MNQSTVFASHLHKILDRGVQFLSYPCMYTEWSDLILLTVSKADVFLMTLILLTISH